MKKKRKWPVTMYDNVNKFKYFRLRVKVDCFCLFNLQSHFKPVCTSTLSPAIEYWSWRQRPSTEVGVCKFVTNIDPCVSEDKIPGYLSSASPSFLDPPQDSQTRTYPSLQNLQKAETFHILEETKKQKTILL